MTDFSQYQVNVDQIVHNIESNLSLLESQPTKKQPTVINELNLLFRDIENVIQSIIAQSSVWETQERREARNYITKLRTDITNFQTRFAPFQDSSNDPTILFNENITGEDIEAPLIVHTPMDNSQASNLNGEVTININDNEGRCIRVLRYIVSSMLILAIIYIISELFA